MKKLLLALAVACGPAHADFMTGNDLLQHFDSDLFASKGYARGYIAGATDALNNILFCLPENVTVGQISDIAILYLRKNPDQRHKMASVLVVTAMSYSFPCKKTK